MMPNLPFTHGAIALAAALFGLACTDAATGPAADASMNADGDADGGSSDSSLEHLTDDRDDIDSATLDAAVPVTVQDAEPGVDLDATDLDAAGPDPAPESCRDDAGDEAGVCGLPPSLCADHRWLVFYDDAQCISGQCAWEKRYIDCAPTSCFFGACQFPPTK